MKSKTTKAKKLSIVKTTIQNLNRLDLQEARGGTVASAICFITVFCSVKPGYPCAWDPAVGMFVSSPGYGSFCPPAPDAQ